MLTYRLSGIAFATVVIKILQAGRNVRFQAHGTSMQPFIRSGDILEVTPISLIEPRYGEIVLLEKSDGKVIAHRIIMVRKLQEEHLFLIKGDNCSRPDGWFSRKSIRGVVVTVERGLKRIHLTSSINLLRARIWLSFAPRFSNLRWVPRQIRQSLRRQIFGEILSS